MQLSCSCQAVLRQSSGSHKVVVRQLSNSHVAVFVHMVHFVVNCAYGTESFFSLLHFRLDKTWFIYQNPSKSLLYLAKKLLFFIFPWTKIGLFIKFVLLKEGFHLYLLPFNFPFIYNLHSNFNYKGSSQCC